MEQSQALEQGQWILANDLKELLAEVEKGEFGDFSNDKYAAPKMELVKKLEELKQNTLNGKYD